MKKILSFALLFALCLCFVACGKEAETTANSTPATVIGDGATVFTFIAKDGTTVKTFEIHTDKENLAEALLEAELIAGDEESYGLYVKYVCGVRADYSLDNAYWALYDNGALSSVGVSEITITAGATYELRRTE